MKRFPLVAALLLALAPALVRGLGSTVPAPITPLTSLSSVLPASAERGPKRRPDAIAVIQLPQQRAVHHGTAAPRRSVTGRGSLPGTSTGPSEKAIAAQHHRAPAPVQTPKGSVWQGPLLHVSSGNIKVYGTDENAARSFILTPNFKNVYAADGEESSSVRDLRAGAIVRVYYSYTLGIRHPNAIVIIRRAPH